MRLTDDLIRRQKRPTKGQAFAWDDLVSGFGVRYTPTGATFIVQWRDSTGRKPRESLRPRFPKLGTEEARARARARLAEVLATREHGGDVALRVAMRAWYERQSSRATWRPRYRIKVDSIVSTYVEGVENARIKLTKRAQAAIAALGKKGVGAVTRTDVLAVADHVKQGTAEQFLAILSSYFNDAYERGIVTGNPARNRLRVTGGRRIRHRKLSDAEFLQLWRAVEREGDPTAGAFMMLALTGARRREVTQMRWSEIDRAASTWTLPPERRKTGRSDPEPFIIALHPAALTIINRQPILDGSPFVFWGRRDERPFEFHYATMQRIHAAAKVQDWRIHDLRRYMRSGLARLGVSQVVAELTLGHQSVKGGLVGVYDAHDYDAEKRDAWNRWGDHIQRITK